METILQVKNLNITLPNGVHIVKDVTFEVNSGEVVALVGPNGCGKSTILKSIARVEEEGKSISGKISYCAGKNILEVNPNERQEFRSQIAYVPQKDDYTCYGKRVTVLDVMLNSANPYFKDVSRRVTKVEISKLFDKYQLRTYDKDSKPLFYEYSSPSKLSGGQQRMVSIISAVAVREDAKLFIIDEPLNNLDFNNARKVSNLITRIHKENPDAAILMVTHCRIFPAITRLITINNGVIVSNEEEYQCHSCFGKANEEGYYE